LFAVKGVSLVVSGHDHIYSRATKDSVLYVTVATLGGQIPPYMKRSEVFRFITTMRNGDDYSFAVRDMEGNIKDRFNITR
jgi:hypothetical protein